MEVIFVILAGAFSQFQIHPICIKIVLEKIVCMKVA